LLVTIDGHYLANFPTCKRIHRLNFNLAVPTLWKVLEMIEMTVRNEYFEAYGIVAAGGIENSK
jgi:hypothetical protein